MLLSPVYFPSPVTLPCPSLEPAHSLLLTSTTRHKHHLFWEVLHFVPAWVTPPGPQAPCFPPYHQRTVLWSGIAFSRLSGC